MKQTAIMLSKQASKQASNCMMYLACFIHLPQTPSKPADVKSWTTFFTNKIEKTPKK